MTSCVISGKSLNSCVPHFPHLLGGDNNTLHLPTSQGCCEDSCGNIRRFKPLGRAVTWPQHFILDCASDVWRSKEKGIPYPANSSHSHSRKASRRNTCKGTARTLSSFFPVISLESKSFVERTLNIFLQIINSYKQSSILCICRSLSFVACTHTGMCPLLTPEG